MARALFVANAGPFVVLIMLESVTVENSYRPFQSADRSAAMCKRKAFSFPTTASALDPQPTKMRKLDPLA